jgi:hypothetical protein
MDSVRPRFSVVFGGFAAVALAIALVGVAGVLAFSVSARPANSASAWPLARSRGISSPVSSPKAP